MWVWDIRRVLKTKLADQVQISAESALVYLALWISKTNFLDTNWQYIVSCGYDDDDASKNLLLFLPVKDGGLESNSNNKRLCSAFSRWISPSNGRFIYCLYWHSWQFNVWLHNCCVTGNLAGRMQILPQAVVFTSVYMPLRKAWHHLFSPTSYYGLNRLAWDL